MDPKSKHTLGAILLWGSPAVALLGLVLMGLDRPMTGAAMASVAIPLAGLGGWLKKRYCPRCLADRCELPGPEQPPSRLPRD